MKTDNMYVKFTGKDGDLHINGKKYAVHSAERKSSDFSRFPICVQVETEVYGQFKTIWMPESMKKGDISIAGTYELGVSEIKKPGTHGMKLEFLNPESAKPLAEVIDDIIKQSFEPGGRAYQMIHQDGSRAFFSDALINTQSITNFKLSESGQVHIRGNGMMEIRDHGGNVRVRTGVLQDTITTLRKALRCPDGADIVTWAEILAAGYFGEKHRKGGAIEDAIHYNKNGAYSDEALAKILAAIVNDGTIC